MLKNLLLVLLVVCLIALRSWNVLGVKQPSSSRPEPVLSHNMNGQPVTAALQGAQFGDDDLMRIAGIPWLERIGLQGSRVTHRGIEALSTLEALESLDLSNTSLTDEAVIAITKLTSLQQLQLLNCDWLKDEHLASLATMKRLKWLELSSPSITSAGLAALSQLPDLQELHLGNCPAIGDEVVESLVGLTTLKSLTLGPMELTSRGYQELRQRLTGIALGGPPVSSLKDLREISKRGTFRLDPDRTSFSDMTPLRGKMDPLLPGDLAFVGSFKTLDSLQLEGDITDDMFLELGPLPQLNSIYLGKTLITDVGLQALAGFPNLESLSTWQIQFIGTGLKHIANLHSLTRVEFHLSQGDEVLEYFTQLTELKELILNAPITDAGLARLPVFPHLKSLWLSNTQVKGPGIAFLAQQPVLTSLGLGASETDDTAIEFLAKLPALRFVSLAETRITAAGVARLRELRPTLTFGEPPRR